MPRLRKSKSPAHTPVPTPTPPVELVQDLASRKGYGALAASSTAIALSIGSAFKHDATVQRRDIGWQTAYDAVRMAVEITKESSDLCLPLKAVVGAISVLIKNFDVGVVHS